MIMSKSKELVEAFKASGYVVGEIAEIKEDGVGLEDLKSIKDIIENKDLLLEGFKVEGDFKDLLKGFSYEELMSIIIAAKEGYELGRK